MAKDDEVEIWESTIPGTIFVQVKDQRNGGWKSARVGGKQGSKKLQITRDEREFNQELIPEENKHLDPFSNGALVRVGQDVTRGRYELTDADLVSIIELEDDALFQEAVRAIEIELPLRRLYALTERHATVARHEFVREVLDERYRVGGTQKAVADMVNAGGVDVQTLS